MFVHQFLLIYHLLNKNLNHVGDWNSSRIIITNEKAKFYLNGEEVLSFIPWSNDWDDKISQTKNFLGTPFGSVMIKVTFASQTTLPS